VVRLNQFDCIEESRILYQKWLKAITIMHNFGKHNKEVAEVLKEYMGYLILFLIPCLMTALVMGLSLEDR
jgi:hypothetical protein